MHLQLHLLLLLPPPAPSLPRLLDASSGALDYLYRAVALFPDGAGYALGSVEGRTTVKYLDGKRTHTPAHTQKLASPWRVNTQT